ncbi:MAG: MFS transporter [Candidatus Berkiellales bacterium]
MDVVNQLDFSRRSLLRACIVWGFAAAFYFFELMLLVSPSVMVDDLTIAFNTSAEELGSLAAFYYYAYALMQIPVGLLIDRFGPRALLTLASFLCALGCLIFAWAPILIWAQCGRFIMGVGGSFAVVGCLKLASWWFPLKRFALLTGIMVAVGMMGGVFGQKPVALLVMSLGWRHTILLGAVVGGILGAMIWFVIADHPKEVEFHPEKLTGGLKAFLKGLIQVMKNPQVWIASLYAGLMFVPTTGFGQLWGVPYFVERYHLEKDVAAWMVSMIFFGWAVGGPLYGWVSDHIHRRKLPMGVAAVGTLVVMLAILYTPASPFTMKILMFLLGAFSSGFIIAFSLVRELNVAILTGTTIGFINTINNASGALAQPVIGELLDKLRDGKVTIEGNPIYSVAMYNEAFLFLPVCIGIAILIMPFIRETYCRPQAA